MKPSPLVSVLFFALLSGSAVGCAPAIGDECETALDCSSQGSRHCDRTQPAGYCTIAGCERGTCPEDSVCVKFRPALERIAVTYCMASCEQNDDCRDDEGYTCTTAAEFEGAEAEVLGKANAEFCSVPILLMSPPPEDDASVSDAELPESSDDAGSN